MQRGAHTCSVGRAGFKCHPACELASGWRGGRTAQLTESLEQDA
jgi:hypothetical protein